MKRGIIIIVFTSLIPWGAWCHPHVFMDTRIEVAYNDRGLAGFWIDWEFDKVFTASILMDFDRDRDKTFSPGEVADIRANAFSNLAISRFMDSLEGKASVDSVYLRVIRRDQVDDTPVLNFEVGYQLTPNGKESDRS